jgi:hypothetical protein
MPDSHFMPLSAISHPPPKIRKSGILLDPVIQNLVKSDIRYPANLLSGTSLVPNIPVPAFSLNPVNPCATYIESLEKGQVPSEWKSANVTLKFKRGQQRILATIDNTMRG